MNEFSTGPDWASPFLILDQIKGKLGKPGQKCMPVFEGMQSKEIDARFGREERLRKVAWEEIKPKNISF